MQRKCLHIACDASPFRRHSRRIRRTVPVSTRLRAALDLATNRCVREDDGTFYGTTGQGAAENDGTVYSITQSGAETVIHNFAGYPYDGANPTAGLINIKGTLYGATRTAGVKYQRTRRNGLLDDSVR